MKKILMMWVLASAFAFAAKVAAQGIFLVSVIDKEGSMPVAHASVTINELNQIQKTNADGNAPFQGVPKGFFTISIEKYGYKPILKEVVIDSDSMSVQIMLRKSGIDLEEVLISGTRNTEQAQSTLKIDVVDMSDFAKNGNITVMDALNNVPGVSTVSTGPGIARPVIRGMTGNRLVTVLNHVRLENQQWDLEHTLGINQYGIDRVEVLKGPASFKYGSDAMGGVLHFVDEKPAPVNTFKATATAGFYSNTFGNISSVDVKQTKGNQYWGVGVGFTNHSDYYNAKFERVANSRFRELNAKAFYGLNYKKSVTLVSYQFNMGFYGIVEPFESDSAAKEEEDHPMEFETPYHTLQHHILSVSNTVHLKSSKIISSVAYQYDGRKELEPKDTEEKPFLGFNLHNANADIKWVQQFGKHASLTAGTQAGYTANSNDGYARLIPEYNQSDIAAYALNQYTFWRKKCIIDLAARYDQRNVSSSLYGVKDSADYMPAINKKYDNLSYSAGMNVEVVKHIYLYANVGMGYRAPNMAELTSNGVRLETQRYEKGNISFLKETNNAFEIGLNVSTADFDFTACGYNNDVRNFIYLSNTLDSVTAKLDGTYRKMQVFQFFQADAQFYGAEAKAEIHPRVLKWFQLNVAYTQTNARFKSMSANLPQIPPYRLYTELTLRNTIWKKFTDTYLRLGYQYTWSQTKVYNELTTPAYQLLNISMGGSSVAYKRAFQVSLGATNLLNTTYLDHLSRLRQYGVYGMGLNVFITIKANLF